MDCPKDGVELELKEDEHLSLQRCAECRGIWMDVADLSRILLRHNMPGLEKLGGTANLEELCGQCPVCLVDLVVIEGGPHKSLRYDTCESCGGIWLEQGVEKTNPVDSIPAIGEAIVGFYKRFGNASQH
jgi:Zn-finger nucleic acid-binding protein